jgi:hypothetical protein
MPHYIKNVFNLTIANTDFSYQPFPLGKAYIEVHVHVCLLKAKKDSAGSMSIQETLPRQYLKLTVVKLKHNLKTKCTWIFFFIP